MLSLQISLADEQCRDSVALWDDQLGASLRRENRSPAPWEMLGDDQPALILSKSRS